MNFRRHRLKFNFLLYALAFGGYCTYLLIKEGFIKRGWTIGWIGLRDMSLTNDVQFAVLIFMVLLAQFYSAYKLRTIQRSTVSSIVRDIFFILTLFIFLILKILNINAFFLINVCSLFSLVGVAYFAQKRRVNGLGWSYLILFLVIMFLEFLLTGGRGHFALPILIIFWYRLNRVSFTARAVLLVSFGLLVYYTTKVKFENVDTDLISSFLIGRLNQFDSIYVSIEHLNWIPIRESVLSLGYFQSIDYLNIFDRPDVEALLYKKILADNEGGFAFHPLAELIWILRGRVMLAGAIYLSILLAIVSFITRIAPKFDLVYYYLPPLVFLVFLKPESTIIIGQMLGKHIVILVVASILIAALEKNIRKRRAIQE